MKIDEKRVLKNIEEINDGVLASLVDSAEIMGKTGLRIEGEVLRKGWKLIYSWSKENNDFTHIILIKWNENLEDYELKD